MNTIISNARAAKAEQHGQLLRAVAGIAEPEPESLSESKPVPPFDGGARQTPERVPSHGETLLALLETRTAHVSRFSE
jgi:hypothetical protein